MTVIYGYAVLWFLLVVCGAMRDRRAWHVPPRDPVRERVEYENRLEYGGRR